MSTQSANATPSKATPLSRLAGRICLAFACTLLLLAAVMAVSGHPIAIATAFAIAICASLILWVTFRRSRAATIRIAMLVCSLTFSVVACELLLRVFTVYPVNGNSNVVADVELGFRMDPALPDADENGFRNPVVRTDAQIVAIGDSHTQGFNVESADAWPMQLGRNLNKTVYNFGTGGYGPQHYEKLVPRALSMNPEAVIVAVYLPNDLSDIREGIRPRLAEPWRADNAAYILRDRTAVGSLVWQTARRLRLDCPAGIEVAHPLNPTFLDNRSLIAGTAAMDLQRPTTEAAFRATLAILKSAADKCRRQQCRFVVLLIPSKERVYESAVLTRTGARSSEYTRMVQSEREVTSLLVRMLAESRIEYADVTERLVKSINVEPDVYPDTGDGHPLRSGYQVYAESVGELLESVRPTVRISTN